MSGIARHHSEWLSLIEVSGPFLTLPVLVRVFPQGLPKVDGKKLGRLRAAYEEWANAQDMKVSDAAALHATWVQLVLGELLEFDEQTLRSGDRLPSGLDVPLAEHHETLRPSMAIVEPSGRANAGTPRLLIVVWPSTQDLESAVPAARWAASPLERMTQLCRSTGVRIGLVTNGERWTIVDAPVGQTAGYASWYAGLWLQEPITLAAFDALLGVRRFFAVADTDTIEALLDESVAFQQEVTDQLGYQVRRAVEVLVQALDRADLDRKRELLRDVPPARLYDAALTVMMRLVFLFCAEERGLLLLGDETYDANYAVSTLRALLREEADRVGVEVLERRQDAWARLLATFRAVHGGVEHEALRLPALGGSLFDPDRFPFLEGRLVGTSWLNSPSSPLPIDNRTVMHLLEALQLLRTRGDGGTSEARKLSYRALDIEQIGHVYEGLLDHVAVRVDTDTLGLAGTKDKEPELSLDELNRERRQGRDGLIGFLKEHTGRSISALRNDLDTEPDEAAEQRLLVACGNDKALVKHIAPYHALIRKDVWGYPQIYRAGSFMVTGGSERRQTGTHYTPKSLTEQIVTETLEPLVYVGPAEGKPRDAWKLRSAAELLDLKICDMAMGSGAFLVQVCRWLAERVAEAWEEAERQGAAISAGGEVLERAGGHDLLPRDRAERLSFARLLVAERCIYGVDINPMAVELAKLSLWLVTLAKGRPFGFLDHHLRTGDSLLGIRRLDELIELSMTQGAVGQKRLFGPSIERAVREAILLRTRLSDLPILDIHDVDAMARLDAEARDKLELAWLIADAFIGEVLASGNTTYALANAIDAMAIQAAQAVDGDRGATDRIRKRAHFALSTELPADKEARKPFHWPLAFPEVFVEGRRGFDAVLGNPPFLGGRKIRGTLGGAYLNYLVTWFGNGASGNADLCAFFVLRAYVLCANNGICGFITTNTIAEGDTRQTGLEYLLKQGARIFSAVDDHPWPGTASVTVAVLHFSKTANRIPCRLGRTPVARITAALKTEEIAEMAQQLRSNHELCFQGSVLAAKGFILSAIEAARVLKASPRNAEVVFPYYTGEEVFNSPELGPKRFVINFFDWPLEKAAQYKEPFRIVEEAVKPVRATVNRKAHRDYWWHFGDKRPALYSRLAQLKRAIIQTRHTKYLAPQFVDTGAVFSESTVVFPSESFGLYAILNSCVHECWARENSGSIGTGLRYTHTDCFYTFPLPDENHSEDTRRVGKRLDELRVSVRVKRQASVNEMLDLVHDPLEGSLDIRALRSCQEELDARVVRSYGWTDLDLGHGFHEVAYLAEGDRIRFTISDAARREILRRLLSLNRQRHQKEVEHERRA
jgi:hypothetical protein